MKRQLPLRDHERDHLLRRGFVRVIRPRSDSLRELDAGDETEDGIVRVITSLCEDLITEDEIRTTGLQPIMRDSGGFTQWDAPIDVCDYREPFVGELLEQGVQPRDFVMMFYLEANP